MLWRTRPGEPRTADAKPVNPLTLSGVACVRGGRLLFEGIDLDLAAGDAAVITGPNGAGKSSLLRIAGGLLRALAGTVRRGRTAWCDESPALDARQPLAEALRFWARIDGGDHVATAMAAMDLQGLADIPVRMLSTGQRRRAGLARAIASGAALWLLDEPTNGLDAASVDRLAAAVTAHRARGGAVLAASHQNLPLSGARTIALGE